jgi:GH15 family glucan-1,4-alpha-glucosidase
MSYQPIENYGIIGDLNTVALVGLNGCIDFMCFPNFDSPTVFAALLDSDHGGTFKINPVFTNMKTKQIYLPDTNVLLTRFLSTAGVGEITDFMPVAELSSTKALIRRVTSIRGNVTYHMNCRPRFNYARSKHRAELKGNQIIFYSEREGKVMLRLTSSVPLKLINQDGFAEFTLKPSESADFILEYLDDHSAPISNPQDFVSQHLKETVNYWKDWMSISKYRGRWMDIINRSTLVLKLLISHQYGTIIASPTFGLPEQIGGKRNWDYRYTWIRDAAFSMYAMVTLGYKKEAGAFMNWVEKRCQDIGKAGHLGIMYSIEGKKQLVETPLPNLKGYKNSFPVRIGNGAYSQLQLDIYGELMDSVYLYNKYGEPISHDFWHSLNEQVNWLCENWQKPDEGIWEVRGGPKHFLYSRFMSWVAIDRAIKLGQARPFPFPDKWKKERNLIYNSVFDDFWDHKLQAFVQYPGAAAVDASSLLMPLIRFISPKDPKWLSTLKRIEADLVSDSLVYRYLPDKAAPDGIGGREGTFSMCTFWYVECLSRSGQLEKARFYFEKMLGYANHLGLYSEQLGFEGEHLGNFPQAFTHLGLISAAFNLNKRLDDKRNKGTDL